jgi:hypothetical protein
MRRTVLLFLVLLPLAVGPAAAVEPTSGPWRALAARMVGGTFTTTVSGKKATEAEAIESARTACKGDGAPCVILSTFSAGCRYVTVGGQRTPKGLMPVFVVETTVEDARKECERMGLVCEHTPRGGCVD